jgi:exosortase
MLTVLAAATALAPSLAGLVADVRYGAPTGDLVAVPVVGALMLDAAVRARRGVWRGRLGHADLVVAGVLVGVALLLVLAPVGRVTNGRWLTRLDVLAHPFALAGFAVLLLGLRVLAVALVPLSYGLLVWPWPIIWLNVHGIGPLTRVTYESAGYCVQLLGLGRMVDVGAENTLRIGAGDAAFEVAVAPACSGVAGIVAYLVVAGSVLALSRGTLRARARWLACGLVAVWVANVVRVVALAAAGQAWGADVALDLLHPVAGLALDGLVVAAMVAALSRFGLTWAPAARTAAEPVVEAGPGPATGFAAPIGPPAARVLAVRCLLVAGLTAALLLADLHVVGAADGTVSLTPRHAVTLADVRPAGGGAEFLGREDWSRVYFGRDSVWNRYRVESDVAAVRDTVWVDSLVVDDADALRAHDVLGCYNFHGARVSDAGTALVAGRIRAQVLVVTQPTGERWQSLHWEWPVPTAHGLRYERVTLFVGGAPLPTRRGAPAASADALRVGAAGRGLAGAVSAVLLAAADRVAAGVLGSTGAEGVTTP